MPSTTAGTTEKVLDYTIIASNALRDLANVINIPFLGSVCNLSLSIIPMIEREKCLRMAGEIDRFLCALGTVCLDSENRASPKMLDQIANYANTLQMFRNILSNQQQFGKLKRIFKQTELITQLDICELALKQASELLILQYGVGISSALVELNVDAEAMHQELLEMLSARSGSVTSASSIRDSSVWSLSLLPALPKIFHGRDSEVCSLVTTLTRDSGTARAAVLGPGGMGKTELATAVLHHPAVVEKYNHRHFISCESFDTNVALVAGVGSYFGLEPSKKLAQAIVRHLADCGPTLILLDNFETPWEPLVSRADVEEFLSLLAGVQNLALLVTIRGAERPGKVQWSRPFLPALEPLSTFAARRIFVDIADEPASVSDQSALDELLEFSGNLPLAASLLANVASFEGYSSTLARWKTENTSLISDGSDKRSNIQKSIVLSLGSPRITSSPDAKSLLSLLSLLPNGIADEDLVVSNVPITHIPRCKSSLIRTSLAYVDVNGRLKTLPPIREYIRRAYPPTPSLAQPLLHHFRDLLDLWGLNRQLASGDLPSRLVNNLGNLNELMLYGLEQLDDISHIAAVAHSILKLNQFSGTMLQGHSALMNRLPDLLHLSPLLRWTYVRAYLNQHILPVPGADPELWISEGVEFFNTVQCPVPEAIYFHNAAARHYKAINPQKATSLNEHAFSLAIRNEDIIACLSTKYDLHVFRRDSQILEIAQEARRIGNTTPGLSTGKWIRREARAQSDLGNLSRAFELCTEASEDLEATGLKDSDRYLTVLDIQANVHVQKSEYLQARAIYAQMVSRTSMSCSPWFHGHALSFLAYTDILTSGNDADISSNLTAAETLYSTFGNARRVLCSWVVAEGYLSAGDTRKARDLFQQTAVRSPYKDITTECMQTLADARYQMDDDPVETFHHAVVYLGLVREAKDRVGTFRALRRLADVLMRLGDEATALVLFQTALQGANEIDIHRLRAECMDGIAGIRESRGEWVEARKLWKAAHHLFVRSSQKTQAATVEAKLVEIGAREDLDRNEPKLGTQEANGCGSDFRIGRVVAS